MSRSESEQRSPGGETSIADATEHVRRTLAESVRIKELLAQHCAEAIAAAGARIVECFQAGNKVLLFGNGGSASDAQHIACEWEGRYVEDRPALPALALTSNSSDLTAIANDYGFERVFARLIEAHGREGDVAIALSTSGNSPNVLAAVEVAKARGLVTIGLSGKGGGALAKAVEHDITVPSEETARIQESHIAIGHIFCEIVEAAMFSGGARS